MSNYRFGIHNYHAIKEADILLEGITVLAGPNGSGKSTISRWLYYLINIATEFDDYLIQEYRKDIHNILQKMSRVSREMWGVFSEASKARMAFRQNIESLEALGNLNFGNLEEYSNKLVTFIDDFSEQLDAFYQNDSISDFRKQRVFNYLDINLADLGESSVAAFFSLTYKQQVDLLLKHVYANRDARTMKKFLTFLRDQLNEDDELPGSLSLEEDGVEIVMEKRIGELLNVEKTIYIDTPMVFDPDDFLKNVFWKKLRYYMMLSNEDVPKSVLPILARIADILNGKIKIEEGLFDSKELFYERSDGKLDLPLDKIATGMKTFAYLFQLLKNGHLNDKTILMIDEPEVHLHPQWVVMFARLLILIHKKLGTKIVLASHNPDFVAAIKAISKKEGMLERTKFYLAKNVAEGSFSFQDLGTDIEPIFESFNIALERIRQYGDTDF